MSPRRLARSRNTSWSTPFSTTAARASCVLALMRISVLIADPRPARHAGLLQKCCRFEQRQTHYARIAALKIGDEYGCAALNGITTGFVVRLAGSPIVAGLGGADRPKCNFTAARSRDQALCRSHGNRGQHLVRAAAQFTQHTFAVTSVVGLHQDFPIENHGGVRGQYRRRGAERPGPPTRVGLLPRKPQYVGVRRLPRPAGFVHRYAKHL